MQTIGGYSYAHYLIVISYQVFIKKVEVRTFMMFFNRRIVLMDKNGGVFFLIIGTIYTNFFLFYCQMKRTNALLESNLLGII